MYAWSVDFRDLDNLWNFYPFVPDGATGNLVAWNWDLDGEETITMYDISEDNRGTVTSSGDDASAGLAVRAALASDPNHEPSRQLRDHIRSRQRSMTAGLKPSTAGS